MSLWSLRDNSGWLSPRRELSEKPTRLVVPDELLLLDRIDRARCLANQISKEFVFALHTLETLVLTYCILVAFQNSG